MSPQTWQEISYILVAVGIGFLVVTIILSIKFQLVSMIRTELSNRKGLAAEKEYFDYVENKNNSIDRIDVSDKASENTKTNRVQTPPDEAKEPVINTKTEKITNEEENDSSTVLVSSGRKKAEPDSGTMIVSKRNPAPANTDDEFVITENIIVINGNPDVIAL